MDINRLFECFEETSTTDAFTNSANLMKSGEYAGVFEKPTTSATKRSHEDVDSEDDRSKKLKEHGDDSMSSSDLNRVSERPTHSHEDNDNEDKSNKLEEEENVSESYSDLNLEKYIPQITIRKLDTVDGCIHEVVLPPDHTYIPLVTSTVEPAKKYSFELDPFQKEAVSCVENRQSVLVSAHTSAGKTVVAEYAIALSLKNNQRVVYTTPIKALSNQKFREFTEEFKDVGLITGDVTINPEASCLVMTTEVLRNMLYRGSEVMREVGWVIFDEIHYMRDKERGVVWEETLILLPDKVNYVFLSATIPNARQFAEWICHLHSQPCHVIYTDYRPTPLEHYLLPPDSDGYLVLDGTGQFQEDNFNSAMTELSDSVEGATREGKDVERRGRRNKKKTEAEKSGYVYCVVREIRMRSLTPVIVFSFSKKDCEAYAKEVAKLDFTRMEEKKLIDEIVTNALEALSEEDRKLPQVQNMIPLLRRGIGIHHGGLLPILKEIIEILFGNGFIMVLFATETFAMGLNMPARSVLFTSCRKFDGKDFRCISSGEYIQMSGRAGRRGLDDTGTVMMILDHTVTSTTLKNIIVGKADPMNSAFRLTYNMVLNLMRVEGINPEYMLERSFYQFQQRSALPGLLDNVKAKREKYESMVIENEESVASYYSMTSQLEQLKAQVKTFVMNRELINMLVRRGRLVKVKTDKYDYGWCIVAQQHKHKDGDPPPNDDVLLVDILIHVRSGWKLKLSEIGVLPCPNNERGTANMITIPHTFIEEISSVSVKYPTKVDIPLVVQTFENMKKKFPNGLPLVDPINDLKIDNPTLRECVENIKCLHERLKDHPLDKNKDERDKLMPQYKKKEEYKEELRLAMAELDRAKSILHMDELKNRKRVLRMLGYCTSSDVIELKGRIACELGSADELLLTELIFNGVFNPLTAEQTAALVSCFVCDSGSQEVAVADELGVVLRQLQEYARRIAKVTMEAKMDLDEEEYVGKFKSTLMDVVHAWAKGVSFLQVSGMTEAFEGSIVRCIRRLEEVLRQLCQAARSIGNADLERKFSEAIRLLKRDIVFAASLYM